MLSLTDKELAALCGMTPTNLRTTYKKNSDPIKQRVYEILRYGAEIWLKKQEEKKKNTELLNIIQSIEAFDLAPGEDAVEYVNRSRKGRFVENSH